VFRAASIGCSVILCAAAAASEPEPRERLQAAQEALSAAIEKASPAYVFITGDRSLGSGVLITPDGLVLTNHHVIAGHDHWQVRLADGRIFTGKVLGKDPQGDIALLRLENANDMPHIPLVPDSDKVSAGQMVFAIGNPFGASGAFGDPSASLGVVSAVHRFQEGYSDAIQTDAPLNPGNSGGPLINLDGELIGINGRIQSRFAQRANTGIGFAVPTNQIKRFIPHFEKAGGGDVRHGLVKGLKFDFPPGEKSPQARVAAVMPGSPAGDALFAAGDLIVAVDGQPVNNYFRFLGVVGTYPQASEVPVTVERAGAADTAPPEPGAAPAPKAGGNARRVPLKVTLSPIAEPKSIITGLSSRSEIEETWTGDAPGIYLKTVGDRGPLKDAGLAAGDRLLELAGKPLRVYLDILEVLAENEPGKTVQLKYLRKGEPLDQAHVIDLKLEPLP
jgi:serine protease Do